MAGMQQDLTLSTQLQSITSLHLVTEAQACEQLSITEVLQF